MYTEMNECNLINADLTRANLMWANMQNANLTGSKTFRTIFVSANMQNMKLLNVDKNGVYLIMQTLKERLGKPLRLEV